MTTTPEVVVIVGGNLRFVIGNLSYESPNSGEGQLPKSVIIGVTIGKTGPRLSLAIHGLHWPHGLCAAWLSWLGSSSRVSSRVPSRVWPCRLRRAGLCLHLRGHRLPAQVDRELARAQEHAGAHGYAGTPGGSR